MAARDYYMVLGVRRDASQAGIRAAFRDLVKRYHPDYAGPLWKRQFQEIVEAYETLGDPELRRSYDKGLHAADRPALRRTGPIAVHPEPLHGYPSPEPLASRRAHFTAGDFFPMSFERLLHDLHGLGIPRAERPERLGFTLELTPDEALRGGAVSILVPVYYPCAACRGAGMTWSRVCPACRGRGMMVEGETLSLHLPPGVQDGATFEAPIRGLGIYNFYLGVTVRVMG